MDFIKKHWEKVLLGVVLVGLAVAVAFLPLKIASEREQMQATRDDIFSRPAKPLPEVDTSYAQSALTRTKSALVLDFSSGHRLFNPVLWQKTSDGRPLKVQSGNEIGPAAVEVVATSPLFTLISFDSIITNETGARYAIGIERQAAARVADRRKRQSYASVGTKEDAFTLVRVQGAPENPDALILEVDGTDGQVSLSRSNAFKRVDGYLADLKYAPESRTWAKRRVGEKLVFAGEEYNIVAINDSEVVLSAPSGKNTTVRSRTAP
jgi:hypothetical protein